LPYFEGRVASWRFESPSSRKSVAVCLASLYEMTERAPRRKYWNQEPTQKTSLQVQESIENGKRKLAEQHILKPSAVNKKIKPHDSYAAHGWDWKYWSASFLFD